MNKQISTLNNTIQFVKNSLENAETGHDWLHIQRVYKTSLEIASLEDCDHFVVALGALLHDIADAKFHNGDESLGAKIASNFLNAQNVDRVTIEHVINIINNISFKNTLENKGEKFDSIELKIVQDADRLDAIGAIGIARTFNYGGYKNRLLYHPEILPNLNMTKEEYKKSSAPTLNHFYEKLLILKDKMNTKTGIEMAKQRHEFMLNFLEQFESEVGIDFKGFMER